MPVVDVVLVCAVALVAAGLSLFSGFGLGTLLLPAFAVVFPVEVAIGATAVVHLANNLFKLGLVGRWADRGVVLRFGLPALGAALVGATLLAGLASAAPLASWSWGRLSGVVTPVGLVVGSLVLAFAVVEASGRVDGVAIDPRWLPVGGLLSGFFGGLSGHQGALRSAFLVRAGLSRDGFVGTTATCSALVDITRLLVYGIAALVAGGGARLHSGAWPVIGLACAAAFAGSFLGARLVNEVTLTAVRRVVVAALVLAGLALASGVS